jgi:DNA-binding CsgD family transcriptional regulator
MTHLADTARRTCRIPRSLGSAAHEVAAVGNDPVRARKIFYSKPVPMVIVDSDRRYLHANAPALLALRVGPSELGGRRIDDLTPPDAQQRLDAKWTRLTERGHVVTWHEVASPDGTVSRVACYALFDALPGQHVIAFAPQGWSELELSGSYGRPDAQATLTPREIELLQLAAEGRTGPLLAEELSVTLATVKTHFEHIYTKLGVRDRAAAVARAMRLGLIE